MTADGRLLFAARALRSFSFVWLSVILALYLAGRGLSATAIGAIALPNPASVALHEKVGFTYAGTYREVGFKFGEWLHVGLWQKELAPRSAEPAEPLPYDEVISPA